jgi:hypothetical protein
MIPQLTAVHYAMNGEFATHNNILTQLIQLIPTMSYKMTYQAMIIEKFGKTIAT